MRESDEELPRSAPVSAKLDHDPDPDSGETLTQVIRELVAVQRQASVLAPILAHPSFDPVLTLEQAAAYTGLTGKTLKIDALAGKLATVRRSDGGHLRARLSDLNAYLNHQRRAATTASKTNNDSIDWSA